MIPPFSAFEFDKKYVMPRPYAARSTVDARQVQAVRLKNHQCVDQSAWAEMVNSERHQGFVMFMPITGFDIGLSEPYVGVTVAKDEEPCTIILTIFNFLPQHFQSMCSRRNERRYGSASASLILCDQQRRCRGGCDFLI